MPNLDGQLFVVAESTSGTYETPAATDLIEVERGSSVFQVGGSTDPLQRDLVRGFLDRAQAVTPESKFWQLSCQTEFKAPAGVPSTGPLTNAPEIHALLIASGLTESGDADQIDYNWLADVNGADGTSVSVLMEEIGSEPNHYKAVGCNFGWTLQATVGERMMWSWDGMGEFYVPAGGSPSSATSNTGTPFVLTTEFAAGGYTQANSVLRDWSLSSGISVQPRPSATAQNTDTITTLNDWPGIVSRDNAVTGSFTVEELAYDSDKYWDRYLGLTAPTDLTFKCEAGSRAVLFTINDAVLGAPQPQQGTPNLLTISFAGSGTSSTSSLTISFS